MLSEALAEKCCMKSNESSPNGQLYIREDYFLPLPSAIRQLMVLTGYFHLSIYVCTRLWTVKSQPLPYT